MFKFIVPVCLSLAILSPSISSGQDCGCDNYDIGSSGCESDCVKTRKKLALVESSIQIKRLRRVCETDECGCSKSRLALVSEPLTFKRLGLVDVPVDPCRPNMFERMRERMASLGGNCGECDCCDACEGDVYEQDSYDGEFIGTDYDSDGGSIGYGAERNDYYAAPIENNDYIETSPRFTAPRAIDVMPRNVQPRSVQPRNVQPRNVQPRNVVPREPTTRRNSSIIDNPIEVEGHSG